MNFRLSSAACVLASALLVSLCSLSAKHGFKLLVISVDELRKRLDIQTEALRTLIEAYNRLVVQNEAAQNSLRDMYNELETHRHDMSSFRQRLTDLEESIKEALSIFQQDAPHEFEECLSTLKLGDQIKSVAFSPDSRLVTAPFNKYRNNVFTLLNVDTQQREEIQVSLHSYRTVKLYRDLADTTSVAFSPDGSMVAIMVPDSSASVLLLDVAAKKQLALLRAESAEGATGTSVAFSPDGRMIATGSTRGLRLWDVVTGELAAVIPKKLVSSVAFSPDSRTLVSGSNDLSDFSVRLWDVATAAQTAILEGHKAVVKSVAFSPDGRTIASGSIDRTVRLWDAVTGVQLALLRGHTERILSVAFSPDGRTLVSGSADSTVRLWDNATGVQTAVLEGHTADVYCVAFRPDGLMIASGGADGLRLWE